MGKLFIWSDTNINTAHRIHKDRQVMVGAILSGILDDNCSHKAATCMGFQSNLETHQKISTDIL